MEVAQKNRVIFDPIYGFITLTPVEWDIIHSPFYQRLRWIKQLGLSCYLFPGAEHSRFGHSIGVMYNAHCILNSCGLAVDLGELCSFEEQSKANRSSEALFHQSLRLAALLHDLGTFPLSHTTEAAYIEFAETTKKKGGKYLSDDHENLGSFIIKNTRYAGGITDILERYQISPKMISDLVKGVNPSILANQILHSEIDCDRMDYLLRDAHYTGLKYGSYDRDYLLYHFKVVKVDNKEILAIKDNALHCVEDFLMARFAWYSQVIRSPRGAKYDILAEKVCLHFLEKGVIYRYSDLLEMIEAGPLKFYGFNDHYFMQNMHQQLESGSLNKTPKMRSMVQTLLFGKGGKVIKSEEFDQRLLSQDDEGISSKIHKRAERKVAEIKQVLDKHGGEEDWMIADIPKKDVIFVMSTGQLVKNKSKQNVLLERDPVKICYDNGDVKLLAEVENSVISQLQNTKNFIPALFCSDSAYQLLLSKKAIVD